jgi:mono/diheme cytochrome c family protein
MRRMVLPALSALLLAMVASAPRFASVEAAVPTKPTFNKDVLPILQRQCQECHRPGAVAPMSFLTYKETRPFARAIEKAVVSKTMPPWFADPTVGHFTNERRLGQDEIATLVAWTQTGAAEGDEKDKPAPRQFAEGWTIGKPDIIVEMPRDIALPPTGLIDQGNVLVTVHFEKDLWVKAAEVRPSNPKTVHHMKAWIRPPGSGWMKNAPEGELYYPKRGDRGADEVQDADGGPLALQDILAKYNPGVEGQYFTAGNAAKFIPAGSDIVFEAHYVTTGKPEIDRAMVGIVLADGPPKNRHMTITGTTNRDWVIPAGDPNFEVRAESTLQEAAQLIWIQPHMHYRGKDFEVLAHLPSGETKQVLKTRFNFAWQIGYELAEPLTLPKGTRLESISHYDNSAANKDNPDPTIDIKYGAQSKDEMHVGFMGILVDAKSDPRNVFRRPAGGGARQVE